MIGSLSGWKLSYNCFFFLGEALGLVYEKKLNSYADESNKSLMQSFGYLWPMTQGLIKKNGYIQLQTFPDSDAYFNLHATFYIVFLFAGLFSFMERDNDSCYEGLIIY